MDEITEVTKRFPTWVSFTNAFGESINSRDYHIKYPELYELIELNYSYADIVSALIKAEYYITKEYDVQEGFELFINKCMEGHHLKDMMDEVDDCIDLFIKQDVIITNDIINRLIKREYKRDDSFEDECIGYIKQKGPLLWLLKRYINIEKYIDFSNVKSMYWEDILEDNTIDCDTKCKMYLKYTFEYYDKDHSANDVL